MKLFYLAIAIVVVTSCRKERLDSSDPVMGKWQMKANVLYGEEVPAYLGGYLYGYYEPYQGPITVEITLNGKLNYHSDSGDETFQLIKKEKKEFRTKHSLNQSESTIVIGHVFTVRNKTGKKFKFKFFYDVTTARLVGVAWYKGVEYNTSDRPIGAGYHYGHYYYPNVSTSERLGVFQKI